MRLWKQLRVAAALVVVCVLTTSSASATPMATSFTADFTKGVFDDTFLRMPKYTNGNPAFVMDNSGLRRAANDNARYYVSTVATDFNTCDFIATLTYDPGATTNNNWARWLWFGIGNGERSSTSDEPSIALCIGLNMCDASSNISAGFYDYRRGINGSATGTAGSLGSVARYTPGVLQITKIGDDITFSWDRNGDGIFDASQTIYNLSTLYPHLTDQNSRIFFGTGWSYCTFASLNVQVIPEPATMALLALGGLTALWRKRR